jgi:biopolymer transport protein ExbD
MRISIAGRIGIALILVGPVLLGCTIRWLAPHPHVALEIPVSLSPGHVITGNFSVNPGTVYYIDIELDKRSPMPAHCEPRSVLSTRWVLLSDGEAQQGSSPWEDSGLTIADLYSFTTRYAFDVEILPGASCLNASNPRLKVQTHPDPSDLYVALTWLSIFPTGIGMALVIRPLISRGIRRIEETRIFPDMVLRNVLPTTKHERLPLIHNPPHWPLLCIGILSILVFTFMVFGPLPSKGLSVTWKKHDALVWEKSPWPEAPEVYVRAPARFFVNGQEVSRTDLRAKLIEQLSRRGEWTVYLDAEPDVAFMEAAHAMDTIQTCGAKLVWITPKVREDWQQKAKESETEQAKKLN